MHVVADNTSLMDDKTKCSDVTADEKVKAEEAAEEEKIGLS